MFEQHNGVFTIYCEERGCSESESFDTDNDFRSFIDEAKADGWKVYKDGDNWAHKCPSCVLRSVLSPTVKPAVRQYILRKDAERFQ